MAAVAPPTSASSSTVSGDDARPTTPRAAAPPSAGTTPSQSLHASIDRLKLEQHRPKTSQKQIVKKLRESERKRRRLRERARQLTDEDLLLSCSCGKKRKRKRRPQLPQRTKTPKRKLARQPPAPAPARGAVKHAQQRSPSRACLQQQCPRPFLQYCRSGPLQRRLAVPAELPRESRVQVHRVVDMRTDPQ